MKLVRAQKAECFAWARHAPASQVVPLQGHQMLQRRAATSPCRAMGCALYRKPKLLVPEEVRSHPGMKHGRKATADVNPLKITRIVIAHRPETIASADRVLVVDGGRCQGIPPVDVPLRDNRPARTAGLL